MKKVKVVEPKIIKRCQRFIKIKKNTVLKPDDVIVDDLYRCRNLASTKDSENSLCSHHRITTTVQGYDDDDEYQMIHTKPKEEKYIDFITFNKSAIIYY